MTHDVDDTFLKMKLASFEYLIRIFQENQGQFRGKELKKDTMQWNEEVKVDTNVKKNDILHLEK